MLGYIFPSGNGVGVPGERDPSNVDPSSDDRFGCHHSDDSESANSQAGNIIGDGLLKLLDAGGAKPEPILVGRYVLPNGALIIGLAAGVICYWGATWLKHVGGYDDSLDVWGVHGIGGITGALLTGVFAVSAVGGDTAKGLIDGNATQVIVQAKGVLCTLVWSGAVTFVLLKLLDLMVGIRVDRDTEREGLDLAIHGETVA